jgi:hypothetical protein
MSLLAGAMVSVRFRVKYYTVWGQNVVVCGSDPRLGAWDVRKGVWMHCQVSRENNLFDNSRCPTLARDLLPRGKRVPL